LSVVAVTEPDRGFTNLNPGDTLKPGQAIRGIHHTEDLYTLNVYEAAGTKSIGSARSAAISGTEWSAKVDFSTQAPLGSVVATDASLADGGLGAMIAVPVQFGTGGTGAPSATPTPTGTAGGLPGYMTTIVGTKDGRVAYFGTASGAFKGYLTGQTAGGGDSAPSMSPDRQWVYFLRGTGTCANEIARVPFPGGGDANVEVVQKPSNGYVFDTMSAGAGGSVTWIERNCVNDQNLALGWAGAAHNSSGRIAVAGGPPTFTGTPRLSPDASKVAVLFVSGMLHSIQVYDVTAAKAIGDTLPGGCTATDGCQGIDFDWAPDGSFVVLTDPSGVVRVVPGAKTAVPLFASEGVIGSRLDLSRDGSGLLVWDAQANAVTVFTVDANRAVPADKTVGGTGLPTW
jgi:hypothetical protein